MLLGVRILFEALNAEHSENTLLRDQRQVNHRSGRFRDAAVDQRPAGVFIRGDVFRKFRRDVVEQDGLAIVDTPDRKLIFVVGAPRVRCIPLAVFDREAVFDQVPLRSVEADAEDTRVHDLVHTLVEFEQNGFEIERSRDLLADVAEQLNAVFLGGDFDSLSANLVGTVVDCGFKGFGLSL